MASPPEGSNGDAIARASEPNLLVGEVTARTCRHRIARNLQGANAGVAAADVEEFAPAAASANAARPASEPCHDRIGKVAPDLRETAVFDVAETVVPPHRI